MKNINSYASLEELGRIRLSKNFFMRDFLHSEIAAWSGMRNIPDHPDRAIYAGSQLCELLLEPLQATFGRIHVRSGYRSPAVNEFGNQNQLNCASNASNYAAHIWDYPDATGKNGATACIVVPWLLEHIERGGQWTDMAWWIHDHLPYSSLCFFPKLAAFNINWHEEPVRRVDSYAQPKGCLIRPGTQSRAGLHGDQYIGFPKLQLNPSTNTLTSAKTAPKFEPVAHPLPVTTPKIIKVEAVKSPEKSKPKPSITPIASANKDSVIIYRAVHSKNKWRKASNHQSLESAINGVNGAAGLFARKVRIDYEKHGDPLFALVWESNASSGFALRPDKNQPNKMQKVAVPIDKFLSFERNGFASEQELIALFR